MPKKIILSYIACITIANISAFALTSSSDYSVEKARKANVTEIMKKVNRLTRYTTRYVNKTLDRSPTRAKIENYFELKDQDIWKNYRGENCVEIDGNCQDNATGGIVFAFDLTENKISFTNIMGDTATISAEELNSFKSYANFDGISNLSTDNTELFFDFMDFPSLENTLRVLEECDANSELECSIEEPTDTTKTWVKTRGDGNFDYLNYDSSTSAWAKTKSNKDGELIFLKDDNFDPTTTPGYETQKALVQTQDDKWKEYIYDGEKWSEKVVEGIGGSSAFNGIGSILDMATTLYSSPGNSTVSSSAPNSEWGGSKLFTKVDDASTGGYWISEDTRYIVANNISTLSSLDMYFSTDDVAWIPNAAENNILKLKKQYSATLGEDVWMYQIVSYSDIFSITTSDYSPVGNEGKFILNTSTNDYFEFDNISEIYKPAFGSNIYINKNGRDSFDLVSNGNTYLIQTNDCTELTCNGESVQSYYAGSTIDGLYAFYYSNSGKNLNNLTDATPYDNWNQFWAEEASAVQWNGTQFGDVPVGSILTKETLNGGIVYSLNGEYINKANGFVIPQNKLPIGITADTATISKYNSKNWINVTALDDFVTDTNLDVGYTVNLTGSGFTNKKIERCSNYDDDSFWSDNCSNNSASTVAVSAGSRSDLVAPVDANRINLTKQVGTEPNYTTNGVAYSADNSYKQWFYSNSGSIISTNNLLDGLPVDSIFGNEDFDDKVFSTWGSFNIDTIYIDNNNQASTINQLGFNKYCKETQIISTEYKHSSLYNSSCNGPLPPDHFKKSIQDNWLIENTQWQDYYFWYQRYLKLSSTGACVSAPNLYGRSKNYDQPIKTATCSLSGEDVWYK